MKYVDTQAALDEAAEVVSASPWAAVDTEADSLHHYVEKLCLVQVSVEGGDFVIDPLAVLSFDRFLKILSGKFLIMHGADFDVRMTRRAGAFEPPAVFDTMIAAQLLGYEKQGLADLALKHCGVSLSKANQKADWSRRPLEPELLEYAANDTHYLRTIQQAMQKELEDLGRLEWHRQACAKMLKSVLEAKPEEADSETEWQVKGSKDLKGFSITVLKELWYWREAEARKKDRPRFKILNTEYLVDIARWVAAHADGDVADMPGAPRNVKREHREALNAVVRKAKTLTPVVFTKPAREWPRKKWRDLESKRLEALKAERQKLAADLKITPSLLATNAVLEKLSLEAPRDVDAMRTLDCLMPWQIEIVADRFLEALKPPPQPS